MRDKDGREGGLRVGGTGLWAWGDLGLLGRCPLCKVMHSEIREKLPTYWRGIDNKDERQLTIGLTILLL